MSDSGEEADVVVQDGMEGDDGVQDDVEGDDGVKNDIEDDDGVEGEFAECRDGTKGGDRVVGSDYDNDGPPPPRDRGRVS